MLPSRIPQVTGVEHIGLTMPDVDVATCFFVDVIGAEVLYDIGPFENPDDWMAAHLAVHPGARIHRMRMLRMANGPSLELFEFAAPEQSAERLNSINVSGFHLAFYVEDMDAALVALKAHNIRIQSGPVIMTEGPSRGLAWLYFQAPWGQQLELVSYPAGIDAYRALAKPVWRPGAV
jgi:catechol 2,3-dioxygenase-like lactoylglutathione lyase family enzyme